MLCTWPSRVDIFRSAFVSTRVNSCAEGDCALCKTDSLFVSEHDRKMTAAGIVQAGLRKVGVQPRGR